MSATFFVTVIRATITAPVTMALLPATPTLTTTLTGTSSFISNIDKRGPCQLVRPALVVRMLMAVSAMALTIIATPMARATTTLEVAALLTLLQRAHLANHKGDTNCLLLIES